jgi:hypothetical protein
MSKTTKSITEQIREAVAACGSQAEALRRIQATGSKLTQPLLSAIMGGQTPSLTTLRDVARATGYRFEVAGETELGTSREKRPSEEPVGTAAEAKRRGRPVRA